MSKYNRKHIDTSQTLEQLENDFWGVYPADASYLVRQCYALRKKQLCSFETEDFRILIGQNIGLSVLLPIALDLLRENFFAEGDYYPGDLLHQVLKSRADFWKQNRDLQKQILELVEENQEKIQTQDLSEKTKRDLQEACRAFAQL